MPSNVGWLALLQCPWLTFSFEGESVADILVVVAGVAMVLGGKNGPKEQKQNGKLHHFVPNFRPRFNRMEVK